MLIEQENVWDFPRPAICEVFAGSLEVEVSGHVLAKTENGFRSLETSHPPSYYIPPTDISMDLLSSNQHVTLCEWKGQASYFDLKIIAQQCFKYYIFAKNHNKNGYFRDTK